MSRQGGSSRFAVLLLAVVLMGCASGRQAREPRVVGDRLTFTLPNLDGETVTSQDDHLEGKVLLVILWGTWCPPCVSEIPTFNNLQQRHAVDGLAVVAIAFEREQQAAARRADLRRFVQEHKINYLVLDGGATDEFAAALPMIEDVEGLPVEIIIDRSGRVVTSRNGYGYSETWARDLEDRLKILLAGDK